MKSHFPSNCLTLADRSDYHLGSFKTTIPCPLDNSSLSLIYHHAHYFELFSILFIPQYFDIFCQKHESIMLFLAYIQLISSLRPNTKQTEAKSIHMKMLSATMATGRITLLVRTFCPPCGSYKPFCN